jgi:hypothetical protein
VNTGSYKPVPPAVVTRQRPADAPMLGTAAVICIAESTVYEAAIPASVTPVTLVFQDRRLPV